MPIDCPGDGGKIILSMRYILTFDIDWAPDYAIEDCMDLIETYGATGTFFATHHTAINKEILERGHIVGIHPNFLPNSSHGNTVDEVMKECLAYNPNAWCMRTHSLVQSSPLLFRIFKNFPQLKLDVSLLMHRSPYAHKCTWESEGVSFERLLYNWEDDCEFTSQRYASDEELFFGNLTVCDFHPIHVFLNSSDGTEYRKLKSCLNGTRLQDLHRETASDFENFKTGVRDHLTSILKSNAKCISLGDI